MDQPTSSNWGTPYSIFDSRSQFRAEYELNRIEHLRSSTLISHEYLLKEMRVVSQSSTPAPPQQSPYGLSNVITIIYRHLYERHCLDRISHSLYICPGSATTASTKLGAGPNSTSIHSFDKTVRVLFPGPAELSDALSQTTDKAYSQQLISALLTEPTFRFSLCQIARLFEVALSVPIGTWEGEYPRELSVDERTYVIKKIQDVFLGLFEEKLIQNCILGFLFYMTSWSSYNTNVDDAEQENIFLPEIAKKIFPCLDLIIQELQNILEVGKDDKALKVEIESLTYFIRDSLKIKSFTKSNLWIPKCVQLVDRLRLSLSNAKYRGPTQRLFRIVVSLVDQLWKGGRTTEIGLAMEKILSGRIQMFSRKHDSMNGRATNLGTDGGWNFMADFEKLVQMASQNTPPIYLPSIVWKRKSLELCIDSMVIQFPPIMPHNIHLNSTIEFDKESKMPFRQWSLKILGVEIEAKATPYCLAIDIPLSGCLVDIGELSCSIPADSLDIELVVMSNSEAIHDLHYAMTSNYIVSENISPPPYNANNGDVVPNGVVALVPKNSFHQRHMVNYRPLENTENSPMSFEELKQSTYKQSSKTLSENIENEYRKNRLFSSQTENTTRTRKPLVKNYIELKNCSVRLQNLEVTVNSTKYPVLNNLVQLIIVRQVRLALEEILRESIIDIIDTVNSGIDGVVSQEVLKSQSREDIQSSSTFDIKQSWG